MFSTGQTKSTSANSSKLSSFLRSKESISGNAPKLASFLERHKQKEDAPKLSAFLSQAKRPNQGSTKLSEFLGKLNRPKLSPGFEGPSQTSAPKLSAFLAQTKSRQTSYTMDAPSVNTTNPTHSVHTVSTVDALRYMMNVVVTKENIKRLAVGLTITTIVSVTAAAALGGVLTTAAGSGLWSFATFLASTSSAKAGVALATKKLKFLNRRIPPTFLAEWSEKLGMPLTRNSTYADILEASINSSTTIATSGIYGLLITQGLKTGAALGKAAYDKVKKGKRGEKVVGGVEELRVRDIPELASLPEKVILAMEIIFYFQIFQELFTRYYTLVIKTTLTLRCLVLV